VDRELLARTHPLVEPSDRDAIVEEPTVGEDRDQSGMDPGELD